MATHSVLDQALQSFGLSAAELNSTGVQAAIAHALRNGGSLAEFFFEQTASTRVFFEGGRLDRVVDGTDRGVGLRIVFDNRQVYGYTTELTAASLHKLAEGLGAAVKGAPFTKGFDFRLAKQPSAEIAGYKIQRSPRDLSLQEKLVIAQKVEQGARAELADARQVTGGLRSRRRKRWPRRERV